MSEVCESTSYLYTSKLLISRVYRVYFIILIDEVNPIIRWPVNVTHLGSLGLKISLVVLRDQSQKGNSACNFQTIAFEPNAFSRIVRH